MVGETIASTFSKARAKSLPDQRAHFLGAQVIGVVVAAAENVGAEDDAAFHFRAEALRARAAVMLEQALRFSAR